MKNFAPLLTVLSFATLGLSMMPVSAQSSTDAVTTGRALVAKYVQFKNEKNANRLSEIYSESYIENTGRNPSGLAALTENWKAQFQAIPDLNVTLEDAVVEGNKVVARMTYSGTHAVPFFGGIPATGKAFKFGTIDIWRVADGKLTEHWDQVDFAGLQRQLTAK
jgi:steroid delta-isomerase-like uncharacterized protein